MTWNPGDHDGCTYFLVPGKEMWIPDVVITNTLVHSYITTYMVDIKV